MSKPWVLHDTYKTQQEASKYGKKVLELSLARGVKVAKNKATKRTKFDLFILPTYTKGEY